MPLSGVAQPDGIEILTSNKQKFAIFGRNPFFVDSQCSAIVCLAASMQIYCELNRN